MTSIDINVGPDDEIFSEFRCVPSRIPYVNVGAWVREFKRNVADGFAISFKEEDGFIEVVAVVKGYRSSRRVSAATVLVEPG